MSDSPAASGAPDWLLDSDVHAAIPAIEAAMLAAVSSDDAGFDDIVRWLIGAGGKRLRPILLLLAARGSRGAVSQDAAIAAAAAVELIHVASLYHDDIMDRAELRRGTPSVNRRWTSPIAGFAGTFILARAMALLDRIGAEASRIGGEHCAAVCLGQLREAENAYNTEWSIDEHLMMLEGKTAELFVLAVNLGAILAGSSVSEKGALQTYGRNLGLAFQLRDDVLDYAGSAESLGKGTASDLREGAYTMPVLLSLSRKGHDAKELHTILRLVHIGDDEIARGVEIVCASGALEETSALARKKSDEAVAAISGLGDAIMRDSLTNLAHLSVERMA